MNKKIVTLLLACSIILLSGCSLAKEEAVENRPDRLVGVYLTTERASEVNGDKNWVEYGTFSADSEFGELKIPKKILPATYDKESKEFIFPDLEGYALFEATVEAEGETYNTVQTDLADGNFHVTSTDYGDSYEISGTLYVGEEMENAVWTANKVYQTEDGLIYLDGSGNSYQGGDFSSKMEETRTTTVNGEEGNVSMIVEFSIQTVQKLEKILVHQYDENGRLIDTQELPVIAEDQDVLWNSNAAWAVVEEHYVDHTVRTAYDRPTGDEEAIHTVIILNNDNVGESYLISFKETK